MNSRINSIKYFNYKYLALNNIYPYDLYTLCDFHPFDFWWYTKLQFKCCLQFQIVHLLFKLEKLNNIIVFKFFILYNILHYFIKYIVYSIKFLNFNFQTFLVLHTYTYLLVVSSVFIEDMSNGTDHNSPRVQTVLLNLKSLIIVYNSLINITMANIYLIVVGVPVSRQFLSLAWKPTALIFDIFF